MAFAMTAVLDTTDPETPFYLVTVSGLSSVAGAATVTVEREYTDFSSVQPSNEPVQGFNQSPVTGDTMDAQDFEVKYMYAGNVVMGGGGFNYHAHVYDDAGAELTDLVVTKANYRDAVLPAILSSFENATVMLQSVQQPALNMPVVVMTFGSWTVPARTLGNYNVLGRPNPVVINDAMGGRTGSFSLLVSTELGASLDAVTSLLTYNDVLIFNPFFAGLGYNPMYFKVSNVAPTLLSHAQVDKLTGGSYLFDSDALYYGVAVDFIETDNPASIGTGPVIATWADIPANFATWGDVRAARSSWLDVLNRADQP